MARLINPSLCFFCARCSQSRGCFSSKLACRVNVEYQPVTGKFQQRRTLTHARRISQFYNGTRKRIWGLGFGAGLLIALGFKNYCDNNERCDCEAETPGQINSVSKYRTAIEISRDLLQRVKDEVGSPGIVIGVSVDGTQVWCEGLGYADVENRVACDVHTVMRIASISKSLTATATAKVWEDGKLDLDAPVQKYVPEFPEKQFEGKDVTITPRRLLSHLSGIRHYEKDVKKVREQKEKARRLLKSPEKLTDNTQAKLKDEKKSIKQGKKEFEQEEYYLKERFESVIEALNLFKDDPLLYKPGTTFLYSTHAFTLLSAVLERAAEQRFLDLMLSMFRELGMLKTVPEENDPIIYNRARFYRHNKNGRIVNCPYVDNSYKWAGGGFLATVGDLLLFGNAMLYSYQLADLENTTGLLPGFLKPDTAKALWAPVDKTEPSWDKDGQYAQGWLVVEMRQNYGQCRVRRHYVSHTGGAVGASSVLLVLPNETLEQKVTPPQGIVVAILANMQSVGLNNTALKIAHEFEKSRDSIAGDD